MQEKKSSGFFSAFKIDKGEAQKTGRFLAFFVIVFIALRLPFELVPGIVIEGAVAGTELAILSALGIFGELVIGETAIISLANGIQIQISELCTGMLELLILVAAIIASIGIRWRERIIGAAAGAVAILLFNFFRITATIIIILAEPGIETIEFAHNVLFRIFLFFAIAIAYIAWFYWAVQRQPDRKTGLLN